MSDLVIWLFAFALSLHNLEEAAGFPRYAPTFKPWQHVSVSTFRFALVVLTALVFVTALLCGLGGPQSVGAYLHAGYMLAMLLNVFVPHLAVSLARGRLMPGTVTALLVIFPVTATGIVAGLKSGWLEPLPFAIYGVSVTTALLLSLPYSFGWVPNSSPNPNAFCGWQTPSAHASDVRRRGRRAWR